VKQQVEKIQAIKSKLSMSKKEGGNYNTMDLADEIYANVQKVKAA